MLAPDHDHMSALTEELGSNKSAKIRRLKEAGYRQADIARFLDISDQFVSNVVRQSQKAASDEPNKGEAESRDDVQHMKLQVGRGGRIVIPADVRTAMGVKEGSILYGCYQDGELTLSTVEAVVRRVQAEFRKYVPEGVSVVDELIADRRREAAKEAEDG